MANGITFVGLDAHKGDQRGDAAAGSTRPWSGVANEKRAHPAAGEAGEARGAR